jgi:transposase
VFGSMLGVMSVTSRGQGMYAVHDWAEVHQLHHVEGLSKSAIAARLGMSRTTVIRLLGLREPPNYQRAPAGSCVDGFADQIAAMLAEDPRVPATVILQRLRAQGFTGGITILKDHLARVRPQFAAAQAWQRTSYRRASWRRPTGGCRRLWCRSARDRPARCPGW